ncbi:acyltransferase family protein [Stackebrandtia nassauensis]|uniref:Acyltransferase 3 n=1 Tax=Stackebrandtia nassauensis (strain DSM 44728 / CIP 108903 / NRRL B-16338 / NBRC 102104 / LLR-40K-21) TaxID=446470 RepID=D3QB37_STANL|nr:acyltransferase [Stackebrandtia nassauensis]ADD40854.1 acyltransferase 3 [Stackebrandtia nassauensis DSM 44728]
MQSLSYRDYRDTRRFAALDGLRAVTVLGLIAHHFQAGKLQPLIGIGKITVFFVLSGFVITLLLLRTEDKSGSIKLRGFYLRRQFRLLPLYYTALAVYCVARFSVGDEWDRLREALPYYLVFLNEYSPTDPDITSFWHSWTLGYEQKFYLVWPLIFIALSRLAPKSRPWWTLGLAGACLALMPVTDGTPVHYFSLFLGCALAMFMHTEGTYRLVRPLTHPVASFAVLCGFAALHLWLPTIARNLGSERYAFVFYALGVAVLIVAIVNSGVGRWVLTRPPLLFIGERGYAMYLFHGIAGAAVMGLAPQWGGSPVRWLLICLVTVVFAEVAHRLVELPFADMGRRFNAWLDQRKAARANAPMPRQHAGEAPAPQPAEAA